MVCCRFTASPGANKAQLLKGGGAPRSRGRTSANDSCRNSIPNPGLNSLLEVSRRQAGPADVQSLFFEQFKNQALSEAGFHRLMAQVCAFV